MSRSLKKGPYVVESLYRKVEKLNESRRRDPIKTWSRACTIVPEFVGHTFKVHNGKGFIHVFSDEDIDEALAVVHLEGVPNKLGNDCAGA